MSKFNKDFGKIDSEVQLSGDEREEGILTILQKLAVVWLERNQMKKRKQIADAEAIADILDVYCLNETIEQSKTRIRDAGYKWNTDGIERGIKSVCAGGTHSEITLAILGV